MILLNFAHPLTEEHLTAIARLTGEPVERVIPVNSQMDMDRPLARQIVGQLDALNIDPASWQTSVWLVNLPSHAAGAGIVLADLQGRMGHFPACVRFRPVTDTAATRFEVAEIINLDAVRQAARQKRTTATC